MTAEHEFTHTGAELSNTIAALLREYTGRGPEHVRVTIGAEAILVTLRGNLTRAEQLLAATGRPGQVLAMRRAFQDTMREDLIETVERISGRKVEAFLSDNLSDPDVAVEVFLMQAEPGVGPG